MHELIIQLYRLNVEFSFFNILLIAFTPHPTYAKIPLDAYFKRKRKQTWNTGISMTNIE